MLCNLPAQGQTDGHWLVTCGRKGRLRNKKSEDLFGAYSKKHVSLHRFLRKTHEVWTMV